MYPEVSPIQVGPTFDIGPLRAFVRDHILSRDPSFEDKEETPLELYKQLHSLGWLQAHLPIELGGSGLATSDLICVGRELAYGSMGIATSSLVNVLALTPIVLFGSPELKERVCLDFAESFSLCSYCMTEPDAGSNLFGTQTRAKKVSGGYRLTGQKCFITNSGYAKHLTVFALLEGDERPPNAGIMLYVPASSEGVERGKPMRKMGQADSNTGEFFFNDVFVPLENRIGNEGQGFEIAIRSLQRSKILIASGAVGVSHRAMDLAASFLKDRKIYFGRPLLQKQTVHCLLAALHTKVEAAWLLASVAACTWDSGDAAVKQASMAKLFAADTAVSTVNEALELCGGYGYSKDYEIERLYRDVKVAEIYEGPTLVQQILIANELFPTSVDRGFARSR